MNCQAFKLKALNTAHRVRKGYWLLRRCIANCDRMFCRSAALRGSLDAVLRRQFMYQGTPPYPQLNTLPFLLWVRALLTHPWTPLSLLARWVKWRVVGTRGEEGMEVAVRIFLALVKGGRGAKIAEWFHNTTTGSVVSVMSLS